MALIMSIFGYNYSIMTTLNISSIFRCMVEEGYYPVFEKSHIQFVLDDNIGVVEFEEGILSVRLFFSIEEDSYELFLEASNSMMLSTDLVKAAILDDMKNIMFSCESLCLTIRDFKRFFPTCIEKLKEALSEHKTEMRNLILTQELISHKIVS